MVLIHRFGRGRQYSLMAASVALGVVATAVWATANHGHDLAQLVTGFWLGLAVRMLFWRSQYDMWLGRVVEAWRLAKRATSLLAAVAAVVGSFILVPDLLGIVVLVVAGVVGFTGQAGWGEGLGSAEWAKRDQAAKLRAKTPAKYQGLG